MSQTETLELKTPIEFGEERITTLTFKDLKARHIRKMSPKPTMDDFLGLVAVSTGLSMSQVNEMSARDAMKAVDIVSNFLIDGQETGEAS